MWYKLDGDNIVPIDIKELKNKEKRHNVSIVHITTGTEEEDNQQTAASFRVSTTFLGLDHNHNFRGENNNTPILFETMIFQDHCIFELEPDEFLGNQDLQIRYHTIQGARKGHKKLVEHVRDELAKKALGEVYIENILVSL